MPSRRTILTTMFGYVICLPFLGLAGCRKKSGGVANRSVQIAFADTDAFYEELHGHLDDGVSVEVTFENERISRESAFIQVVFGAAENKDEVVGWLNELDTTEGAALLARVFADNALDHESCKEQLLVGNEVCDPGTILFVVVVAIATASAAAISVMAAARKFRVELDLTTRYGRVVVKPI